MKKLLLVLPLAAMLGAPASAATIGIDLSGAASGTLITAPGGSFASTFQGQTIVAGTGISGSPSNPLALLPGNTLNIDFWNPFVSPAGNSILPQPGNQGPLSVLLDSDASSLTWTMGYGNPPSALTVDLFDAAGGPVTSRAIGILDGYNVYNLSGVGVFRGLTFYNNNDASGLRFMNFSYTTAVPEPATIGTVFMAMSLLGWAALRRRSS